MELKSCPFCGSNEVNFGYHMPKFGEQVMYFVSCDICKSRTANFRRKSVAAEMWNVRAET